MLVFTSIIILFSGLVYFSIVNFSHQRFYELLKIRTTTIIQIEKGKEYLDLPENYILNSLNDEELPMEKDYVLLFQEIPISVKYLRKFIFLFLFRNIVKNGEANFNDKEFYYIKGRLFLGLMIKTI